MRFPEVSIVAVGVTTVPLISRMPLLTVTWLVNVAVAAWVTTVVPAVIVREALVVLPEIV